MGKTGNEADVKDPVELERQRYRGVRFKKKMGSRKEEQLSFEEEKGHLMLEVTRKAMRVGMVVKIGTREGERVELVRDHT